MRTTSTVAQRLAMLAGSVLALAACAAVAAVPPPPPPPPPPPLRAEQLVGTWRLLEWYTDDGVARRYPFGKDASGVLSYARAAAAMSVSIARAARAPLPPKPDDAALAAAYRSYFNYAGRWSLPAAGAARAVTHHIAHALDPALVGANLTRSVRFVAPDGDADGDGARRQPRVMRLVGPLPGGGGETVIVWREVLW